MCEAVAGADDEVIEGVVGVELWCELQNRGSGDRFGVIIIGGKADGDEVACDLLGDCCESVCTVFGEVLCFCFVWASYFQ